MVDKDKQVFEKVTVFSYENKLNMSIISSQINDNGYYYKYCWIFSGFNI